MNLKSKGTLYAGAGAAAPSWLLLLVEAVLLLVVVTSAAAAFRCQLPRKGSRLNAVWQGEETQDVLRRARAPLQLADDNRCNMWPQDRDSQVWCVPLDS
jgi:hypothetical protein